MRNAPAEREFGMGGIIPELKKEFPKKPQLEVIEGGKGKENKTASPARPPESDDWVWENRIKDVKEGRRQVSKMFYKDQTPEKDIEEFRETIRTNRENKEWDAAIQKAHTKADFEEYKKNLQTDTENAEWADKKRTAELRAYIQEVDGFDFQGNTEKRINALEGFLSPAEMKDLRESFREITLATREEGLSHEQQLDQANAIIDYIESREAEIEKERQRQQRIEQAKNFPSPAPSTPAPKTGLWKKIRGLFSK